MQARPVRNLVKEGPTYASCTFFLGSEPKHKRWFTVALSDIARTLIVEPPRDIGGTRKEINGDAGRLLTDARETSYRI